MLAALLGVVMLMAALGLLAIGWQVFDLGNHSGQLQTFTFQTLLFFALFSLVSIRERRVFWASQPSMTLAIALAVDGMIGLLIGVFGLADLAPLRPAATMLILLSAAMTTIGANDWIKRMFFRRWEHGNPVFGGDSF